MISWSMGERLWHGAHQGAQNPTKTGSWERRTSLEKVASVTVATLLFSFLRAMKSAFLRRGLLQDTAIAGELFAKKTTNRIATPLSQPAGRKPLSLGRLYSTKWGSFCQDDEHFSASESPELG